MSEPHELVQFLDATVFFAREEVVHLTGLSAAELAELAESACSLQRPAAATPRRWCAPAGAPRNCAMPSNSMSPAWRLQSACWRASRSWKRACSSSPAKCRANRRSQIGAARLENPKLEAGASGLRRLNGMQVPGWENFNSR